MKTLTTLTQEARYLLAVLAVSIVGMSVALVITGDRMDNLARLVFAVGIASASVIASVVLMGEARDRDLNTLTRSSVARIATMNEHHRAEMRARMDELTTTIDALSEMRAWYRTYATALETVTRDAHKTRTPSEAFDLACYLVDYREENAPFVLNLAGIFTGNEYAYGTWDEFDPSAIVRAVAKWNDAVAEHPTR